MQPWEPWDAPFQEGSIRSTPSGLICLVNESNPRYRISHALIINGFDRDSDLDDTGSFKRIREAYDR